MPARVQGWSDPAFGRVAEVVHLVAGLVFPANRQPSAEAGMRRAMGALRLSDPDALGRAVQQPGDARDAVLAELTVGESYFFREEAQLGILETHVLPAARQAAAMRPLRIWSAGCASGEEPYTVAIKLRELGWAAPVEVLGTDVALPRLAAARRARYTRWALRGVSEERVERWFTHRGAQFQLDAAVARDVRFAPLNLAADEYPSVATGTAECDLVLCRNVLIYFDMDVVARIATRLVASLAAGGWLVLGASDPPLAGVVDCEAVMLPGGTVYRRPDAAAPAAAFTLRDPVATPWWMPAIPEEELPLLAYFAAPDPPREETPAPLPAADERPVRLVSAVATPDTGTAAAAYAAGDYAGAEALAREEVARPDAVAESWVLLVRALANQGRLRDADERCVHALDHFALVPELHYLHATLLGAAGQHREAINAARRALYLNPRLVMAHLALGEASARLGDDDRAARAFANAAALLEGVPDDAVVPAADGVPAARLRGVARQRLGAMERAS